MHTNDPKCPNTYRVLLDDIAIDLRRSDETFGMHILRIGGDRAGQLVFGPFPGGAQKIITWYPSVTVAEVQTLIDRSNP